MQPVAASFNAWMRQDDGDHFFLSARPVPGDAWYSRPQIPAGYPNRLLFAPGVPVPISQSANPLRPGLTRCPRRLWLGPEFVEMEVGQEILTYRHVNGLLTELVGTREKKYEEVGFYD